MFVKETQTLIHALQGHYKTLTARVILYLFSPKVVCLMKTHLFSVCGCVFLQRASEAEKNNMFFLLP